MRFQWLAMMVALLLFVACNNPDSGDTGATQKGADSHGHDHDSDHADDDHADDDHADDAHADDDHADDDHADDAHADDDHADDDDQEKENGSSSAAHENEPADKSDLKPEDVVVGDDAVEPETETESTVAAQLAKIKADYEKDVEQFMSDYKAASKEEQAEMRPKFGELRVGAATKSLEIAREVAETDDAIQGLLMACQMGNSDEKEEAMGLLLKHHADSESIGELCTTLSRSQPSAETEASLKKILAKSPHDKVKAAAQYGLINFYKSAASAKKFAASNASFKPPQFVLDFDPDSVDMEAMYTTLRDEYGSLESARGTYGELAERALFEIQNLSIGKVAPDIEGKDLDGEPFKLSDYRGKVVMLDFWGDW